MQELIFNLTRHMHVSISYLEKKALNGVQKEVTKPMKNTFAQIN